MNEFEAAGFAERARRLVDAARMVDEPSAADRERVRSRLTAAIAGAATLSDAASHAGPSAAASGGQAQPGLLTSWVKAGVATKLTVNALVFVLSAAATTAAVHLYSVGSHEGAAKRAAAAVPESPPELSQAHEQAHEVQDSPAPEADPTPAPAPTNRSKRARPLHPKATPAPPPSIEETMVAQELPPPVQLPAAPAPAAATPLGMGGELSLLTAAQRALSAGDLAHALGLLDQHAARYPTGALAPERWAARAATLCRMHRGAEGMKQLQVLATRAPSSPLLTWARRYCSQD